ncbi:MAG: MBL fold metallo-hydrolase [Phycisphaeraceae bacterium]|nr:MBL fold metallo-hydrolase [Phycisphaeraceae bacterium]
MRITLCGAAGGEVTGSGYLVETARAKVLVDYGMFQGVCATEARNVSIDPVVPASLDAVVLTHAHLDHCGRLPLLVRHGMRCGIYCTHATADFATLVLTDAARIQAADAERENRYRRRESRKDCNLEPLYSAIDLENSLPLFRHVAYNATAEIAPGISVRLVDAGHIMGSASIEMTVREGASTRTVVFSADIGRWDSPILRNPTTLDKADLVFLESTYGEREHRSQDATSDEFAQVLQEAVWNKEKVLIPAFAIGRSQQVLYHIAELVRSQRVPEFPIYLDSPMAIRATELYRKHAAHFDEESAGLLRTGRLREDLRNLYFTESPDESRALNDKRGACIIIAGGGMCEGGRIVHHLRHSIWRHGVGIVFVGFASRGTLGRQIIDGAQEVEIFRKRIPVRARVSTIGGFSAHAGQSELLRWLEPLAPSAPPVYLTHGEDPQRAALSKAISERFGLHAHSPAVGDVIEL